MRFKGIILLLLLGSMQNGFSQSPEDKLLIDSLREVAESNVHDTIRIKALSDWDNLVYYYDKEQDLLLNQEILNICELHQHSTSLSAREYDLYGLAAQNAHNNLGLTLSELGDFGLSVKHFYKSMQISEARQDSYGIAKAHNNLGLTYQEQHLFDKAIEHHELAFNACDDCMAVHQSYYNNMGVVYSLMDKNELAKSFFIKGLEFIDPETDQSPKANLYVNIADLFAKVKEYDSAHYYYRQALPIYLETNDITGLAYVYTYGAATYLKAGNINKALEEIEMGRKYARMSGTVVYESKALSVAYDIYSKAGIKDSLISIMNQRYEVDIDKFNKSEYEDAANYVHRFNYEKIMIQDSLNHLNELKIQEVEHSANIENERNKQYILYGGISLSLLLLFLAFRGFKRKQRDNQIISDQKAEVESKREELAEKNKEITDSISYAKRIQDALLPSNERRQQLLPSSFLIYLPKDIVAGDFYWLEEKDDLLLFAVADCTGHGVPGAMVSVICHNSLNRCVREFGLTDPGHILTKCRELVIEHFTESNEQVKDGMDIALCCWNRSTNQLVYSGAHNSLYLVRNGELSEFIGNKQPVGYFENAKEFSTEELEVKQGDRIYLSSDGFPDQFGGEKGKKFKYKPFKQLLLSSSTESTDRQKEIIRDTFTNWKGNYEQLDDVCIIGIEV